MSIVKHKDHMMKSILMVPKWTSHQPPFPEWWDKLPPTVQNTARQQHHLCRWGYSHRSGTELLTTHGSSPLRCSGLLWLNVLFAGSWGWRHREPFYLPYHEPALVIECQVSPQEKYFSARNIFFRKKSFSPQVIYFFSARNLYRKQARSVLQSVAGHSGAQQHQHSPLRARPLQSSKGRPFHTIIHKLNLAQFIDRWRHTNGCDYLSIEVLFHLGASFIIGN